MTKLIDPAAIAAADASEHAQQVAVFAWSALQVASGACPELRWLHAVPNGGLRDKRTAAMLKAEGVRSGVPDLDWPWRKRDHAGLRIEMKQKGYTDSKVSQDQRDWHKWLSSQGYFVAVCGGYEEAICCIKQYMSLP